MIEPIINNLLYPLLAVLLGSIFFHCFKHEKYKFYLMAFGIYCVILFILFVFGMMKDILHIQAIKSDYLTLKDTVSVCSLMLSMNSLGFFINLLIAFFFIHKIMKLKTKKDQGKITRDEKEPPN